MGLVPRPPRERGWAQEGPGCTVGTRARHQLPSIPDIRVPVSLRTKKAPVIGVLEPPGRPAPGKLVVWVEVSGEAWELGEHVQSEHDGRHRERPKAGHSPNTALTARHSPCRAGSRLCVCLEPQHVQRRGLGL